MPMSNLHFWIFCFVLGQRRTNLFFLGNEAQKPTFEQNGGSFVYSNWWTLQLKNKNLNTNTNKNKNKNKTLFAWAEFAWSNRCLQSLIDPKTWREKRKKNTVPEFVWSNLACTRICMESPLFALVSQSRNFDRINLS